ncbi:hypothetical protein GCM10020219_103610 [Nonomuraea dietziae]
MDHAYESFGTTSPGGRTLACVACEATAKAPADEAKKLAATRSGAMPQPA